MTKQNKIPIRTLKETKDYIKRTRRTAFDAKHLLTTPNEIIILNEKIKLCEQLLHWLHIPQKDWG